jgi:Na+/proline symporter
MKFCSKCGAEINDDAVICVKCGCQISQANNVNTSDRPSGGFAVLGFFIPLVGLILYLVWKKDTPLKAKSCGKGALIGFIVGIVVSIIWGIVVGVAAASYY